MTEDTAATRKTASTTVSVHPLLAERWSPRGFDRAHEIGDEALSALLEAARWAPSAGNSQPWRFLVTRRGAAVTGSSPSSPPAIRPGRGGQRAYPGRGAHRGRRRPSQPVALYDTGQAVAALVTQAQADGLSVHQMGGFDTDAVRAGLGLAEG